MEPHRATGINGDNECKSFRKASVNGREGIFIDLNRHHL